MVGHACMIGDSCFNGHGKTLWGVRSKKEVKIKTNSRPLQGGPSLRVLCHIIVLDNGRNFINCHG